MIQSCFISFRNTVKFEAAFWCFCISDTTLDIYPTDNRKYESTLVSYKCKSESTKMISVRARSTVILHAEKKLNV